MEPLSLSAYSPASPTLKRHVLPLHRAGDRCVVELRNLPGADALHVLISDGDNPLFRAEVPARSGERLRLGIGRDAAGLCHVDCQGREFTLLPAKPLLLPCQQPIDLSGQQESLEWVVVVDASSRLFSRSSEAGIWQSAFLLKDKARWQALVDQIMRFANGFAGVYELSQTAVLAFGDQPTPDVAAQDLRQPQYWLWPRDTGPGLLRALSTAETERQLLALQPSTGGDFVDALADALAACQDLFWTPSARKLLLLVGDSPGHSILHPPPAGADACIREHDVDSQALRLYRRGVAIVTLYLDPTPEYAASLLDSQREFLQFAANQYQRLASLPNWAFTASRFDGAAAAETILGQTGLLGHGASFGELLGILQADGTLTPSLE